MLDTVLKIHANSDVKLIRNYTFFVSYLTVQSPNLGHWEGDRPTHLFDVDLYASSSTQRSPVAS